MYVVRDTPVRGQQLTSVSLRMINDLLIILEDNIYTQSGGNIAGLQDMKQTNQRAAQRQQQNISMALQFNTHN